VLAVDHNAVTSIAQATIRAGLQAGMAAYTAILQPLQLGLRREALRVMAPDAAQWTTLEKHCRADTRPILGGQALKVKDISLMIRCGGFHGQ
jgi:hypothetical protein